MALADHQSLILSLFPDPVEGLSVGDRDQALAAAVTRYSQDRPLEAYESVTAVLPTHYLHLPLGWAPNFSRITYIERPIGETPPRYLDSEGWELIRTSMGLRIWLEELTSASEIVGLIFTVPHVVDATEDTVPETDRLAVACFAASLLCEQLATLASGQGAPTIDADAVDHQNKASLYASRGKRFEQRYTDHLGLQPKRNAAAGTVVAPRERDSRGRRRLFKRRGGEYL